MAIEHFDSNEIATMVGLVANLEPDPESDDIIDQVIRRCQAIRDEISPPVYEGSFPVERLKDGEFVRSAGDGTAACEIGNDENGWSRLEVGDPLPPRRERT